MSKTYSIPIRYIDVSIIACIFISGFLLYTNQMPRNIFRYDEADYAYAASKGFVANYLDRPSINLRSFFSKGLEHVRNGSTEGGLSHFIRQSGDITFYRHFHAPFYFYLITFAKSINLPIEFKYRLVSLLLFLMTVSACYLGLRSIGGNNAVEIAVISSMLLFFNIISLVAATYVSPHNVYNLFCFISLIFLAKFWKSLDLRLFHFSVIALAFSFLSMEYAPILLIVTISVFLLRLNALKKNYDKKRILKSAGFACVLFLGCIIFVWPPALYKLSMMKSYMMFVYYSIFRGDTYGSLSLTGLLALHFKSSPFIYSFFSFGLIAYVWSLIIKKNRALMAYIPFILYFAIYSLTIIRNRSQLGIYVSSVLPPLACLAGAGVVSVFKTLSQTTKANIWFFILPFAVAIIISGLPYQKTANYYVPNLKSIIEYYQKKAIGNSIIAVNSLFIPIIHYYFPNVTPIPYTNFKELNAIIDGNKVDRILFLVKRNSPEFINFKTEVTGLETTILGKDTKKSEVIVDYFIEK